MLKVSKTQKNKEIYLDFASATPVSLFVRNAMQKAGAFFANPGAIHALGREARAIYEDARKTVASLIEARTEEIIFTASATEANNLAIRGVIKTWRKQNKGIPHIIVSSIEHASVLETARSLQSEGVEVTYLPVDKEGIVLLPELKKSLRKNTVLVSIMYANNEIGTLQPMDDIAKIVRHFRKDNNSIYPLLHTDAVQAFQSVPIRVVKPEVNLMTLSSGKIYGPRGIALLYVKKGTPIESIMSGGGQEFGLRGGTETLALAVGFAEALGETIRLRNKETARLEKIYSSSIALIKKEIPFAHINGSFKNHVPHILSLTIPGIESDYLVLELSAKKIYVSAKSACGSDNGEDSHVILAIGGVPTDGSLRLSFGRDTKLSDVKKTILVLKNAIKKWQEWN